jgi:UTP:GlnB (protein PII) uridylyltransferase
VGVGGYGRGELFPFSDVDLLVLLGSPPDALTQARLENFVQLLWDLGLEIGHSIRTVDECMSESKADITVQTSLLEARLVCGSEDAVRRTAAALRRGDGPAGLLPRQDRRDAAAPRQVRIHALQRWSRTSRKARARCATCR